MDLHRTSSRAPVCDAERPPSGAFELPLAGDLQMDALEAQITRLWGHINAATAQFLALLAEFDRKEGWAQHGMASCAQWLNWQCGIGRVAAREKVQSVDAVDEVRDKVHTLLKSDSPDPQDASTADHPNPIVGDFVQVARMTTLSDVARRGRDGRGPLRRMQGEAGLIQSLSIM